MKKYHILVTYFICLTLFGPGGGGGGGKLAHCQAFSSITQNPFNQSSPHVVTLIIHI